MHGVGGASARHPGLADIAPWTSREATAVEQVPASLAILGGGVVGAEMATAFQSLGTDVTLIARSGLLGGNEPFAGELVASALRDRGVTVKLGARRHGGPPRRRRARRARTVGRHDGDGR